MRSENIIAIHSFLSKKKLLQSRYKETQADVLVYQKEKVIFSDTIKMTISENNYSAYVIDFYWEINPKTCGKLCLPNSANSDFQIFRFFENLLAITLFDNNDIQIIID